MLDLKFIRENKEIVKKELRNRNLKVDLDFFLELDEKRRKLVAENDQLRAEQNKASKIIVREKDARKKQALIEKMKEVSKKVDQIKTKLVPLTIEFLEIYFQFPNISHKDTPVGKDENDNIEDHKWGKIPRFTFKPKPHYEIESLKDLFDIEKGSEISGARFWYLKGKIAQLQFALINYTIDFFAKEGFELVIPPVLVKKPAMIGSGFFPADCSEVYEIREKEDSLYLIGTAEVPLASYHANEIIDLKKPKKYLGYSTCFRREAGSYGKDLKGIMRGHQFDKLELFVFASQKNSWKIYEELLRTSERFWQSLKIPYRVMSMCSGELASPNSRKFDIEGWLPGEGKYRELGSCSHDTDFQARRLNIRYRDEKNKVVLAHTMNHTACAIGRTIVAIVENNQTKKGNVKIPKVLHKYLNFTEI